MAKIFNRIFGLLIVVAVSLPLTTKAQSNHTDKEVKSVTTTRTVTTTQTRIVAIDTLASLRPDSVRPGGRLVWVPDSLTPEVRELLKGHSRVVDDPLRLDVGEKTVFRGDTLPMVLKSRNLGRYDRGLFNFLFIPKGTWQFGLTVSYGEFSTSNMSMLNLVSDVDLNAHQFTIRPYLGYFIRNNLSVGIRLGYTNANAGINSLKMDIDEDMNFSLHDIGYKSESYTAALTLQQFYGISRRGRFGVYNEIELAFASGSSDFTRPFNGELKSTHSTHMEAKLTFSPGVSVFVMENVSFNVSFGVFGFYLRNERQTENGVQLGNRFTSGANFRINLFNLAFGLGIHI